MGGSSDSPLTFDRPSGAESGAFLTALDATDRTAADRWVRLQGVDARDATTVAAAKKKYRESQLLSSPVLVALARRILPAVLGRSIDSATSFRATVWSGKFDVGGEIPGAAIESTFGEFVAWLEERAQVVAEKGAGIVCCPTVNRDGKRINASTLAMTALNLDCDGLAEWDALLAALRSAGLAYVAYQSGGWRSGEPKWHVLLPLDHHFDTSSPERIDAWKAAYNKARVIFGALAGLPGDGFDPTIETPCTPVFVTERRRAEDPPRRVVWSPGRTLDIERLAALLPSISFDDMPLLSRSKIATQSISDDRFEQIVGALEEPMSRVLSGRRDLYLALPGALLDRGIAPDDMRAIIEELSERCPGDPRYTRTEIASKHREHLHCADTTVARFDSGDEYTRIGTISDRWRDVAEAIDLVLPDPFLLEVQARLTAAFARQNKISTPTSPNSIELPPLLVSPVINVDALRCRLLELRKRKVQSKDVFQKIRGAILAALLDGEDLIPRYIDESTGEARVAAMNCAGRLYTRESALRVAAAMVGGKLPVGTLFEHVDYLFQRSIHAMLDPGESSAKLMSIANRSFLHAVGNKIARDDVTRAAAKRLADGLAIRGD